MATIATIAATHNTTNNNKQQHRKYKFYFFWLASRLCCATVGCVVVAVAEQCPEANCLALMLRCLLVVDYMLVVLPHPAAVA